MSERKVTTDALETLGMIHKTEQRRDAIHLAVEPVEASEKMWPGDHIAVKDGIASRAEEGKGLGIVDPFLIGPVRPGERFWFVMYPRMVHSLRHVWTHPAFADEPVVKSAASAKRESEAVLDRVADEADITRKALIEGALDYIENGEYLVQGGKWEGFSIPDDFWAHFEVVTGRKVSEDKRGNFFGCSC